MRSRGQLSFDMFFAVIFAMLAVQQLLAVTEQMTGASQQISIASQERIIGNNLAAIISGSAALAEPNGTFAITYKIPEIADTNKLGLQKCEIGITNNPTGDDTITVSYPEGVPSGEQITTTVAFIVPSTLSVGAGATDNIPGSAKCGDTITISK